mgnify:CR=1 FL=1
MATMDLHATVACGLVLLIVLLAPAVAGAAAGEGYDEVPMSKPLRPWVAVVYVIVFLAGIGVVAAKNAKRTHLD